MIDALGQIGVVCAMLTFLAGGVYVDYKVWRWVLGFFKREWQAWKGDANVS
jgi:hypothetical protein